VINILYFLIISFDFFFFDFFFTKTISFSNLFYFSYIIFFFNSSFLKDLYFSCMITWFGMKYSSLKIFISFRRVSLEKFFLRTKNFSVYSIYLSVFTYSFKGSGKPFNKELTLSLKFLSLCPS
jgi:hypothetical protein